VLEGLMGSAEKPLYKEEADKGIGIASAIS
jgi:hypothetical protein